MVLVSDNLPFLSDKKNINESTYFNILRLTSNTPILEQVIRSRKFNPNELFGLLSKNAEVALNLYKNSNLLNFETTCQLALIHKDLALELLKDPKLFTHHSRHLELLAHKFFEVAQTVLNNPTYRKKLSRFERARIAGFHSSLAEKLYKNRKKENLPLNCLWELAKNCPFIAKGILTNSKYYQYLTGEILVLLSANAECATIIFDNPQFKPLLTTSVLLQIGARCPTLAPQILGLIMEDLKTGPMRTGIIDFVLSTEEIAKEFLTNEWLQRYLSGDVLVAIGRKYPPLSLDIVKSKLQNRLRSKDIAKLSKDKDTANYIFDNAKSKLCGPLLAELGARHFHIAKAILEDKKCIDKLASFNLLILASNFIGIGRDILSSTHLKKRLASDQINSIEQIIGAADSICMSAQQKTQSLSNLVQNAAHVPKRRPSR